MCETFNTNVDRCRLDVLILLNRLIFVRKEILKLLSLLKSPLEHKILNHSL